MAQVRRKQSKPITEASRQRSVDVVRKLAASTAGDRVRHGAAAAAGGEAALGAEQARAVAFARALFRASFLVAASDGELAPEERQRLLDTMCAVTNGVATRATVEAMIQDSIAGMARHGFEAALAEVGRTVEDPQDAEAVFLVAVGIAAVDGHVEDDELEALDMLGTALRIPRERSRALAADSLSLVKSAADEAI